MNKWSIRKRLVVGFCVILFLVVLIGATAGVETLTIKRGGQTVSYEWRPKVFWNYRSFKDAQAESSLRRGTYVRLEHSCFYGLARSAQFVGQLELSTDSSEREVTMTVP